MILDRVAITGFRSLSGTQDIHIDQFVTVLIGANDHGKTNLLDAIRALNDDSTLRSADRNWDTTDSDAPKIEWTFELTASETEQLLHRAKLLQAEQEAARSSAPHELQDSEEDTDDEPTPPVAAKTTAKSASVAADDEDEDDEDDEEAETPVVVAAAIDPVEPKVVNIHLFDAKELRERFDRAYAARKKAGQRIALGRGIWVSLYLEDGDDSVYHVGAGIGVVHPPIARLPLNLDAGSGGDGRPTMPPTSGRAGAGDEFQP